MSLSAIIPMYNEKPRVKYVVESIQKCKDVAEIICVDDGSTDGSYEFVRSGFANVIVKKHQRNIGKLQAVKTGLDFSTSETILLMDADLTNINYQELDKAIEAFEKNKLDCLLLCTRPMNFVDSIARYVFRLAHIATGCRIIKKEVLEQSIRKSVKLGYHLEPAQNKYLMETNRKVAYVNISAIGILKSKKVGFLRGLLQELIMWYEVLSYSSFLFNVKQTFLFARKRIEI